MAAASVNGAVRDLDGAWSACPTTLRRARLLEVPGWAFYVAGRGGVLGDDVRPDTVAAAIGLIAPDAVRAGWEAARKVGPAEVAASRLAECARWGEAHLGLLAEVDRLVALAERVVIAADGIGMPLFAACRAAPVPVGGPGARAAVLAHLLYEHRAGAFLIGIRACRLTPAEALIAGPEGAEEAIAFGWQPPFPARAALMRRYIYAEALADRVAGQAYAGLVPHERRELAGLLRAAADAARSA
jgi:hypothetical protein